MKKLTILISCLLILCVAGTAFSRTGRGGPPARLFTNNQGLPSNEQDTNPTATDDASKGYKVGDFRVNESTNVLWWCLDSTNNAAVWGGVTQYTLAFFESGVSVLGGVTVIGQVTFGGVAFPTSDGNNGDTLQTDGSGTASWTVVNTGGSLWTGGANKVYVSGATKVGINTATPTAKLHVVNTADASGATAFSVHDNTGHADFMIDGDGDIGIGTTDPEVQLHIDKSTGGELKLTRTVGSAGGTISAISFGNEDVDDSLARLLAIQDGATDSAKLLFYTEVAGGALIVRMVITSEGNILINNETSSGASLFIEGGGNASSTTPFAVQDSTGVIDFMIDGDGDIGIGTTAPDVQLHVDRSTGGELKLTRTVGGASQTLGSIAFGNVDIDNNLANITAIQDGATDSARLIFNTEVAGGANIERMVLTSGGNVLVGTTIDGDGAGSGASLQVVSGISIAGGAIPSGLTAFASFGSGASPTAIANGMAIFGWQKQAWVITEEGFTTQFSPHDPETGEIYTNSFNYWTGEGLRYYPLSGITEEYTVPKVDWLAFQGDQQKKDFLQDTVEISGVDAFKQKAIENNQKWIQAKVTGQRQAWIAADIQASEVEVTMDEALESGTTKLKTNHKYKAPKYFKYKARAEAEQAADEKHTTAFATIQAKWDVVEQHSIDLESSTITYETAYRMNGDTLEAYQKEKVTVTKAKLNVPPRRKLKAGMTWNEDNQKFYRKRTEAEYTIDLAAIQAKYDILPQFLKDAIPRP